MSTAEEEVTPAGSGLLPRFTLKDGDTFLLADALGDIHGAHDGLFTNDTRLLSRFEMHLWQRRPSLLGAAISEDNTQFTSHLTNRPLSILGEFAVPQGVIHIERTRFLCDGRWYERMRFSNYSGQRASLPLQLAFAADFADIFEVQGHHRPDRGEVLEPEIGSDFVTLAYNGLDRRLRATQLRFSRLPETISSKHAAFNLELPLGEVPELWLEIGPPLAARPSAERFAAAQARLTQSMYARVRQAATIDGSGRLFNEWINRSQSDLALLTTVLPTGPYPYAGIPWFATTFGRDAIITSLQTLWLNPALAAGVLRFLAMTQAREQSAFRDAEPGKILHEMRRGEMAALNEVPFRQYYGGVDTTPLFVMLAGAYEKRTGDTALVDEIWEHLLAATAWIERRLDGSASGFLDYARGASSGLVNQGWKDSHDSIFHADGSLPTGPVAVIEVQGYACAALRSMAHLAQAREQPQSHRHWSERAERLADSIEQRFWAEELGFYAIAMDGPDRLCKVRASNAGHLLFCGTPPRDRANRVVEQLLSSRFCSGWGIRTLAEGEARYNPMSYHNGSIWPHDTSISAAGIARYFGGERIVPLASQLFEAANRFRMRLPELYCGFPRDPGQQQPTPYPVACLPQAWASGAVFMLLQSLLGIQIEGRRGLIRVDKPALPIGIETLTIRGLQIGEERIELQFQRDGTQVVVTQKLPQRSKVQILTRP